MIGQLFAKLAAFFVNHTVAAVAASVVVCSAVIGYGHDLCIDVDGSFWDNWFNFDGE